MTTNKKVIMEKLTEYFDLVQNQIEHCAKNVKFSKIETSNIISNVYLNVLNLFELIK